MRRAALALMILLGLGAAGCFVMLAGAESPAARAAESALFLVLILVVTGLSFLVWPRGAR